MACDDRHSDWKDFPNGLQVLLVDEDVKTLNEYKCKLEECKYIVTPFTDGTEALKCANTSGRTFHVALVEAMIGEGLEGLRLLKEMSKYLPVVLMSSTHNMALMMQGIAMGAADFLQKPLSDEKLRNIWTHVMRKAVTTGDLALMETLAPSKTKTSTVFHVSTPRDVHTKKNVFKADGASTEGCAKRGLCKEKGDDEPAAKMCRVESSTLGSIRVPTGDENLRAGFEQDRIEEASSRSDSPEQANEDLAASMLMPKLEWGDQLLCQPADIHVMSDESLVDMDGDYLQQIGQDKEPQKDEQDKKPKLKIEPTDDHGYDSVVLDDIEDTGTELDPCSLLSIPSDIRDFPMEGLDGGEVHDHDFNTETEAAMMSMIKGDEEEERSACAGTNTMMGTDEEASDEHGLYADEHGGKGGKSGRRKMKVDWTPELHRRFVQAVEQLGVEKAIPSRILELMGVQCLTRHNIASHLQKYRSHRRHVLAREAAEAATWQQHRRPPEGSVWPRMRRDGTPWVSSHTSPPPIQPRPAIGTPSSVQPLAALPGPPPQPAPHRPMMMLHVWGHPSMEPAPPMWQPPVGVPMQPMWPATDGSMWGQPRMGMPVGPMPPMSGFYLPTTPSIPFVPAMHPPAPGTSSMDEAMPLPFYHQLLDDPELAGTCGKPFEPHPPMDVLEATINEALSNPRTAQLPLGLKAPSVEGVMAELYKNTFVKV